MVRPSRPVLKISPITNEIVQRYPSVVSANLSMGIGYTSPRIMNVCRGKRSTCRGFIWKYETETYVRSRPVIAKNVDTDVEFYFPSVSRTWKDIFSVCFENPIVISNSCKSGKSYRGFIFCYKDDEDGFDNFDPPGSVKSFGTGKKSVLKLDKVTRGVICGYGSITKAAVTLLDRGWNIMSIKNGISMCCHGWTQTAYGYRWLFLPEIIVTPPSDDKFDDKE